MDVDGTVHFGHSQFISSAHDGVSERFEEKRHVSPVDGRAVLFRVLHAMDVQPEVVVTAASQPSHVSECGGGEAGVCY